MKIKLPSNIGFFLLAFIAIIFLTVNGVLLVSWQGEIKEAQRVAEEAAKPAEIKITALVAGECQDCFDFESLVNVLRNDPQLKLIEEEKFDYNLNQGKNLVEKYNLSRLPAVLIEGETEKALNRAPFLNDFGRMAEKVFVLDNLIPPYLEIATGEVRGRYTVTYLTDKGCVECYDVTLHRQIMQSYAAEPFKEQSIDRFEPDGKKFIADYSIEKVPTILLSGDLGEYQSLQEIWPQVGTIEEDGTYVFRATEVMGPYFDLETGKVEQIESQ